MRKLLLSLSLLIMSLAPERVRAEEEVLIKYFDIAEGRLAFTYQKGTKRNIYILDFAALEAVPLKDSRGNSESPRFSPDGQKLAFVSDRNGKKEIFVSKSDGSDAVRISSGGTDEFDPDWSPDGTKIVFATGKVGSGISLSTMNADGSSVMALTNTKKHNRTPRWSPSGKEVTFMTDEYWPGTDLLAINLQTKKISIITTGYGSSSQPLYSKDGHHLVYVSGPIEDPDILIQRSSAKAEPLIARGGKDISPEYYNEKKLWFLGDAGEGHLEVFLHDIDKKEDIQITQTLGNVLDLSWTPISLKMKTSLSSESSSVATEVPPPVAASSESSSSAANPEVK